MGNKTNSFYIKRTHTRSYEKRLNLSFEVVVVFVKKKKGIICHRANNVACHLFGMKKNEITGKSLLFLSDSQQPFTDKPIEAIISEKSQALLNSKDGKNSFYWAFKKNGGVFYSMVHLRLIILGTKKGFQVLLTEISDKIKNGPKKGLEFQKDGILIEGELYSDYSTYIPKKREKPKYVPRKKTGALNKKKKKKKKKPPTKKKNKPKIIKASPQNNNTRTGRAQKRSATNTGQKISRSLSCSTRTTKTIRLKNHYRKQKKAISSNSENESFSIQDPITQLDTTLDQIKLEVSSFKNETLEDQVNEKLDSLATFVKEMIHTNEKNTDNLRASISKERKEFKKEVQTLENSLHRRLMDLEKEKEQKISAFDNNIKFKKQLTEISKLFQKQIGLNSKITGCLQCENIN
ncbi:hypothetical protein M0812_11599 [Anaeramoeba flamelloides]|uniref:PAS domain-containing protein n=1 Tax=Anaeramoeba flamelloides TaxID=1746091 RepID=A0AAV7ZZ01_9EUKA|nr:hypothetical protein M0812_11599 [Anaeramoeba flamelloides]